MQYSAYNSWSPPAQSNETSNGYFLERSPSARLTLRKACDLLPEDEPEEVENIEDPEADPCPMSDPTVGATFTIPEEQEKEGTSGSTSTVNNANEQTELHSSGVPRPSIVKNKEELSKEQKENEESSK